MRSQSSQRRRSLPRHCARRSSPVNSKAEIAFWSRSGRSGSASVSQRCARLWRELEHQGLLRKQPQRGTYVAQLSPEDYQRILEVRIPLEAIAVGKATARLTPDSEEKLTNLVMTMAATEHDSNVRNFHDCDVLFHRTIWELAGNEYLSELIETITFRLFVFSIVGRWDDTPNATTERIAAIRQHLSILEGIRTGDSQKARQAFVRNTVKYWNEQYGLRLNEEEMLIQA